LNFNTDLLSIDTIKTNYTIFINGSHIVKKKKIIIFQYNNKITIAEKPVNKQVYRKRYLSIYSLQINDVQRVYEYNRKQISNRHKLHYYNTTCSL